MQTEGILVAERAPVDMFCDRCEKEITEGEDFFYDDVKEENCCESCVAPQS